MLKNTLTMVISKDGEERRGGEGQRRSGILPGDQGRVITTPSGLRL